jgi:hypothetical protein
MFIPVGGCEYRSAAYSLPNSHLNHYSQPMATEDVSSEQQSEKKANDFVDIDVTQVKEVDLVAYYEEAAGRLVVDPGYLAVAYSGSAVADSLATH